MESRMMPPQSQHGFVLVTVLIVTAVGLLFGAGALLLFKYQCQLRIDRQHEMEKVYAVRSALNYVRKYPGEPKEGRFEFRYQTGSDRNLGVIVEPVKAIFPELNNALHLDIGNEGYNNRYFAARNPDSGQYDVSLDYEYGAMSNGVVLTDIKVVNGEAGKNAVIGNARPGGMKGLAFKDLHARATDNVKWWVNIGMRGTGGWLQEDYGRRYYFQPLNYVDGTTVKDTMRLCLIRNVTNKLNKAGCRHGWPLSAGEKALVFQISPMANIESDEVNAIMTLSEYECFGGDQNNISKTTLIGLTNCPSMCAMGMQIADNKISLFYISNKRLAASKSGYEYVFSNTREMSLKTYDYFADGIFTNEFGKLEAPELRATFEVEATSDMRTEEAALESSSDTESRYDFLTKFRVTPAYQYDVYVEHPAFVTNRATVAQRLSVYSRFASEAASTVVTYDTHGTEHKGFRQDEREAARKNGR